MSTKEISIITTTHNIEGYEIVEYLGVLYCADIEYAGCVIEPLTRKRKDLKELVEDMKLRTDERIALIGLTVDCLGSTYPTEYGTLVKVRKKTEGQLAEGINDLYEKGNELENRINKLEKVCDKYLPFYKT